jgi:hypothetical protein
MSTTTTPLIAVAAIGYSGIVDSVNAIGPKKKGDKKKPEPAPTTVKPSTPVPPPIPPASKTTVTPTSSNTESQLLSDAEKGLTGANLNNLNSFLNGFKPTS